MIQPGKGGQQDVHKDINPVVISNCGDSGIAIANGGVGRDGFIARFIDARGKDRLAAACGERR